MDSFDTILEYLKQAREHGKTAIEGRTDAVTERLKVLVDEATASIRETLTKEAEQLFPVGDLTQALDDMNRRMDELKEEKDRIHRELEGVREQLAEAGTAAGGGPSLDLLRRLDAETSQSGLLKELLPVLCETVARAAVLVIRGGEVTVWSGIGFSDAENLRGWKTSVPQSPAIEALVSQSCPVRFTPDADPVFQGWLSGEGLPRNSMLVPVSLRGQLMGCLYIDDGGDGPWKTDEAQALIAIACWMIDTLGSRKETPSPMVAEAVGLDVPAEDTEEIPAAAPPEEETVVEVEEAEVEVETEPAAVEEEIEEEIVVEEPAEPATEETFEESGDAVAPPEPEIPVPATPSAEEFDPSATMRVDVAAEMLQTPPPVVPAPEPEPVTEPEQEPEPEPEPEPVAEAASPASVQVTPPVGSVQVTPPPPLEEPAEEPGGERSAEDQAKHDEARRFARLLISEIKLYNEDEVRQGCVEKDLYRRLKDDIDRSREMYDKRISEEVRSTTDYFKDEMIRILADGDESALGM